jgi:hypothetical protein
LKVNIGKYKKDGSRNVLVKFSNDDFFSLDSTLALIILPALVMFKKCKGGAPRVSNEDVPEELRIETEKTFFKRWSWILDETIWTFEQLNNEGRYSNIGPEFKEHEERISNGLRLFGKYFQSLWT